jgi:hypothetical protein
MEGPSVYTGNYGHFSDCTAVKERSLGIPPNIPDGKDDKKQSLKYIRISTLVYLACII